MHSKAPFTLAALTSALCSLFIVSEAYAAEHPALDKGLGNTSGVSAVAASLLPKDPRYWQWHDWYIKHSVLNVLINGADLAHVEETLRELQKMKKRGVLIGDVAIIGTRSDPSKNTPGQTKEQILQTQRIAELVRDLGLDDAHATDGTSIAKRLGISFSPTWVVGFRGKKYVYEGLTSPSRLFDSSGGFIDF